MRHASSATERSTRLASQIQVLRSRKGQLLTGKYKIKVLNLSFVGFVNLRPVLFPINGLCNLAKVLCLNDSVALEPHGGRRRGCPNHFECRIPCTIMGPILECRYDVAILICPSPR